MERRRFLSLAALGLAASRSHAAPALPRVALTDTSVVLGGSAPLTGPLAGFGESIRAGVEAAFAEANAAGGVQGRTLFFQLADDGYEANRSVENVKRLLADDSVLAFVSNFGTPNLAATIPLLEKAGMPLVGAGSGADSLRRPEFRNVFHVRASYGEETRALVRQITDMGLTKLAVVHLDNAFGREIAQDAAAMATERQASIVSSLPIDTAGGQAPAIVQKLLAAQPAAVLLGTAGAASLPVVRAIREKSPGLPIVGLSVALSAQDAQQLGAQGKGLAITRVVPLAHKTSMAITRAYQAAMRATGKDRFEQGSLEAYIAGRVMIEGLQRCGRNLTRERLRDQLAGLGNLDLGGFGLRFGGNSPYVGSKFVELGILGDKGGLVA